MLHGISTGALTGVRDFWPHAIPAARLYGTRAVELNAAQPDRLTTLLFHLEAHPRSLDAFDWVSVHGCPAVAADWELTAHMIGKLPLHVGHVVLHPDWLDDAAYRCLRPLAGRIAVENMDPRKSYGTTISDINEVFEQLPHAGFVLDIAHTHAIDSTDRLADQFAATFASRLVELHCSVIDPLTGVHKSPSASDLLWLTALLDRLPAVPRIWEALPAVLDKQLDA